MHTPDTLHVEDKPLEKIFIVGSLALDSNIHLAAEARVLLDVQSSVSDCARLTKDMRGMILGPDLS